MRRAAERASTRRMDCETGERARSRPSASGWRKSVGMCRASHIRRARTRMRGRSALQEDVEDFPFKRTLKAAHHAHPFVAHPCRPVEAPHHRLRRHPPRGKVVETSRHSPYAHLSTLYAVNLQETRPYMRHRLICGFGPFPADYAPGLEFVYL